MCDFVGSHMGIHVFHGPRFMGQRAEAMLKSMEENFQEGFWVPREFL